MEELDSITVQRNGQVETILYEDLIPVSLIHFNSGNVINPNGHVAGNDSDFADAEKLLSDRKLNTGIINPGGELIPLSATPTNSTPGMAVQFNQPLVNLPGPDAVVFELQCMVNRIDGDAFYVSPYRFEPHHKTHRIDKFDLSLASPEAQRLPRFSLLQFTQPVRNVQELWDLPRTSTTPRLVFHALAVSIDLSDLGFKPLEQADALFFQDAFDTIEDTFDPVLIAGLPALSERMPKKQ